ncbi:MAG: GyrI-like domain-containing protein [Bdellovibrionales bacterium]|nr:GyrI-like domain-containing protein [Bdellovibrionales bacterium]
MLKWFLLAVFGTILVGAVYLYIYLGGYREVRLSETDSPSINVVYQQHTGPYHKVNAVIEAVEAWAQRQGLKCERTFGEYLDDPDKVEPERLRSHGGCIVDQLPQELPTGFLSRRIEPGPALQAEFRGAPSIGPMTVYPKVYQYLTEHRLKLVGAPLEVYQAIAGGEFLTLYIFPLEKPSAPVDQ